MPAQSDLRQTLRQLADTRDAVILAHNYQPAEIQDVADHVADSLELARLATTEKHRIILFCGVHFMAETAHILSPQKTVLLPTPNAGCPMADTVTASELRALKAQHPDAVVVTYVNSSAEVKAETDVCCTSANAVEVVERFPRDQKILFVPDKNLGGYVARQTGREKTMILWQGCCHVHDALEAAELHETLAAHPDAVVMAHPECGAEVLELADLVTSTSGMLRYPATSDATTFIVATETGMLHRLRTSYPEKHFVAGSNSTLCPDMKLTTLESCVAALEHPTPEQHITVPPEIRQRALRAVERMIEEG